MGNKEQGLRTQNKGWGRRTRDVGTEQRLLATEQWVRTQNKGWGHKIRAAGNRTRAAGNRGRAADNRTRAAGNRTKGGDTNQRRLAKKIGKKLSIGISSLWYLYQAKS